MKCTHASEFSITEPRKREGGNPSNVSFHSHSILMQKLVLDFSQKSWHFSQGAEGSRTQPHQIDLRSSSAGGAMETSSPSKRGTAAPTEGLRRTGAKGFPTSLRHGPTISLRTHDTDTCLHKLHSALDGGNGAETPRAPTSRARGVPKGGHWRPRAEARIHRSPSAHRRGSAPLGAGSQLCRKEHTLPLISPSLSLRPAAFHAANMASPM